VALSILSHTQAKIHFARARPHLTPWLDYAGDMSYPSGHAAGSMVVLLTAALLIRERRLHWAAVALSLAIGMTRPMLGMHWPSDVIGGWMWGAGFALLGTGVAMKLGLPRVRVVAD
jgi:undecaprenyl-diphosphatase